MHYEVTTIDKINFGVTGAEEVLQNVSFILSTAVYSCPMDRGFGWAPYLDSSILAAKSINEARILQAIQENEPRAIVEEIRFEGDALNGKLKPFVRVRINESI